MREARWWSIAVVGTAAMLATLLALISPTTWQMNVGLAAVAVFVAFWFGVGTRVADGSRGATVVVVVTILSGFTRQATFIVAGAFVVAWLLSLPSPAQRNKWAWPALASAGTAVAVQVVQTLLFPFSQGNQYMRMTQTDSLWEAVLATPALVKNILIQEFATYVLVDQVLVVLLVLCAISMIVFWRRTESHLLLGALLGVALYNITNGNATQFRYAIPGIVFFLASVSLLLSQVLAKVPLNRPGSSNDLEIPTGALPRS